MAAPKNGNKKVTNPNNQNIAFEVVDGYSEIIIYQTNSLLKINLIADD